jgi:hypothetical protein
MLATPPEYWADVKKTNVINPGFATPLKNIRLLSMD